MHFIRKTSALFAALVLIYSSSIHAQNSDTSYPNRPVRVLLPLPVGSGIDVLVRALGKDFYEKTGQTLVVENRIGANTVVSTNACAKAPPDGYTLCVITSSFSLNPYLYKNLPFDSEKDLKPITQLIFAPEVILMNPKLPANSFKELVAYSKANPGKLNYASFGVGGTPHLAFEWLKHEGGLDITHIPYAGSPPAMQALMAGQVDLVFVSVGNPGIVSAIEGGKVKAILVPGNKRNPTVPNVPSFQEVGLPAFSVKTWHGLAAPAGIPSSTVSKLSEIFRSILKNPEFDKSVIKPMAVEPVGSTPEEFSRYLLEDRKNGAALVKLSGAKLE